MSFWIEPLFSSFISSLTYRPRNIGHHLLNLLMWWNIILEAGSATFVVAPTSAIFIVERAIAGHASIGIFTGAIMVGQGACIALNDEWAVEVSGGLFHCGSLEGNSNDV